MLSNNERRTSALHEFKTRTGHGDIWCKNFALNIGDCVFFMTRMIILMSVPSHAPRKPLAYRDSNNFSSMSNPPSSDMSILFLNIFTLVAFTVCR